MYIDGLRFVATSPYFLTMSLAKASGAIMWSASDVVSQTFLPTLSSDILLETSYAQRKNSQRSISVSVATPIVSLIFHFKITPSLYQMLTCFQYILSYGAT